MNQQWFRNFVTHDGIEVLVVRTAEHPFVFTVYSRQKTEYDSGHIQKVQSTVEGSTDIIRLWGDEDIVAYYDIRED